MSDKFDKKLTNKILPRFAEAKEWSDLMTILKKLKDNLMKYKVANMGILTDKVSLAKRLAQCLNQTLPGGVHEMGLDIYSMLFENIKANNNQFLGDNLGLYSAGLFPFFIYASAKNKVKFLDDIIKKHYLTLELSELKLSLPGVLASILPGLEEQDETIQKSIKEIFKNSREKVGDSYFFGTLWSIIFRNKKLRIDCIKYINEIIPTYSEMMDQEEENKSNENDNEKNNKENENVNEEKENEDENDDIEKDIEDEENENEKENNDNKEKGENQIKSSKIKLKREEVLEKFYPNLNILVLNSLKELIVNSELHTQRMSMDFIISHFPITNNIFSENEKISLLTAGLKLLIKNDYSTTRRLLIWLMGPNQDEEIEMGESNIQYMIVLLVKSLKLMFNNSVKSKEELLNSIKIIDQLLKQQVKLVDYILEPISIEMILIIQDYWDNYSKQQPKDEVIQKIKNFFIYDSGYLESLWNSLGKKLNSMNKNLSTNNIKIINKTINEFHSILKVLNFCLEYISLEKIHNKIKYYIPIISSLLKSFPIFKIDNISDLYTIEPFLELALKIVKSLQLGFNNREEDDIRNNSYISEIGNYNNGIFNNDNDNNTQFNDEIYNTLIQNQIKFSSKKGNSLQYIIREGQQSTNLIQLFAENIYSYQTKTYISICKVILDTINVYIYYNEKNEKSDENMSDYIIQNDNSLEIIKIFKYSTELAILTQEYMNMNNINFSLITGNNTEIPEWINYLEKIIFSPSIDLSLEAINYLLDLFMVSSENIIYDNIKSYLRTEDINENIINENFLEELLRQTHVSKNCIELAMSRLWVLIEDQSHQKPVADLLIKFFVADPNIFQNTISNTFAINDIEQNVIAIKNFSQFWKLTSEFYPNIIFFENGECIFKMLDFLDHDHPLLRHLSKSWLSESKNQFRKITDPLLKVLLDRDTHWYISFQKQLFFTKEYDNRRIIEAFRKLKNIIINVPDIAITYFISEKISKNLLEMDEIGKELRLVTKTITMEYYLELLVTISLRFIQGKFIESVSQQFYRENFSVNAASCEFLEFLLSFIEQKSKVMDIAQSIVEPVLNILQESLKTDDEVMQVQLINLLKELLISTSEEHQNFKEQASMIFNSSMFQDCIVSGIQINYIFVRGYFIHFVESCLPVFKKILGSDQNLTMGKKLLLTTTDFLVSRVKYNIIKKKELNNEESKLSKQKKYNNWNSLYLKEGDSFFIIKNYLPEYKELKRLDENDVTVIIKGLKNIIFHFLNIDEVEENEINLIQNGEQYKISTKGNKFNWEEIKKIMIDSNKGSLFSFFGLFSSQQTSNNNNSNNIVENEHLSNNTENIRNISEEDIIYKILDVCEDVFGALCTCWINSLGNDQIKDYCLNEFGILSGDFDDVSFMETKNTKTQINIQRQQLKQLILVILWNVYVKYPLSFMKNILKLFMNENNKYISKDKQYKLTIIEILVEMKIPVDIFLLSVTKNINENKIKNVEKSQNKINGYYPYVLKKEQVAFEAKLCQLVYAFFIFSYNGIGNNYPKTESKKNSEIWNEIINLITILFESKSLLTISWLFEIINAAMYIFPIREITSDSSVKKRMSTILVNLFNKVMEIVINDNVESVFSEANQLIAPLPPSVYQSVAYELYGEKISKISLFRDISRGKNLLNLKHFGNEEKIKNLENKEIVKIEKEEDNFTDNNIQKDPLKGLYETINNYIENSQIIDPKKLTFIFRNIGFICLSNLFYSTMKNIFLSDKMAPYFCVIVNDLLALIKKKRNLGAIQNKSKTEEEIQSDILVDLSTKFLNNLMKNAPSITYISSKDKIMDFFLDPNFFNMSIKNLRLWKNIISEFSHSYNEIINNLMDKINQGGGFFTKNTDTLNIIAMRRLSFIIYSCPKDMYSLKLSQIMEKVKEVITKYCENPTLLNEIFLMLRVMFLRFSNDNLIELIRKLWPIIFAEIVTILTLKRKNLTKDLNLGCSKLVELLSVSNMEEFCLYQWIFFIDSYNIDDVDIHNSDSNSQLYYLLNTQDNCFKPFAFSMAKNWNKCTEFVDAFNRRNYDIFQKRSLIIQIKKIIDEDQFASLIAKMFTYVGIMNNFNEVIDSESIEKVIENDFLNYSD